MDQIVSTSQLDAVQSGDLLAWSDTSHWNDTETDWWGRLILMIVRGFTFSEYGHVGIAYRNEEGLYVLEATQPYIRFTRIIEGSVFYHLPMGIEWQESYLDILKEKIGTRYSVLDAIRGYLGMAVDDNNRWQCVELSNYSYLKMGIDLKVGRLTPSNIVKAALLWSKKGLFLINTEGEEFNG